MKIEQLSLRCFRNASTLDLPQLGQTIVLRGANAQGKTNILEALYLCATGRSFRGAPARDMLQQGQPAGSVKARLQRQGVRHDVEVQLKPQQRLLRVDGRSLRQVTSLLELLNMVAFFPDDLRIAKGSPEERRRFLDRAVANSQAPFVAATLAYHKALKSRNALLRAPTAPDRALLGAYDTQLVRLGCVMHQCRVALLADLLPVAQEHFASMMQGHPAGAQLDVELHSGLGAPATSPTPEALAEAFAAALAASYPRDRARGMTNVGPHRADLLLRVGGRDARAFASQGQQRAMVLALKLAEVVCLARRLGSPPILLLDDVSSELDAERTRRLFDVVQQVQSQVWISTTGAVPLPVPGAAQTFAVEHGAARQL